MEISILICAPSLRSSKQWTLNYVTSAIPKASVVTVAELHGALSCVAAAVVTWGRNDFSSSSFRGDATRSRSEKRSGARLKDHSVAGLTARARVYAPSSGNVSQLSSVMCDRPDAGGPGSSTTFSGPDRLRAAQIADGVFLRSFSRRCIAVARRPEPACAPESRHARDLTP